MKQEMKRGDAYHLVKAVYDKSPGKSWRRLNDALHSALSAAIVGHLSFLPDDFQAIRSDTNGGYWMGDGGGSAHGERYYSLMVEVGHTPACISFEKYAGRPAALWAEDVKTPARLCDGARFTWEGERVTVTNLRDDSLIACTYKPGSRYAGESKAGEIVYWDHEYVRIEQIIADGPVTHIRTRKEEGLKHIAKIAKRFTITYEDLAAKRKEYDTRRKEALKKIAEVETEEQFSELSAELAALPRHTFRHFDIEDVRTALAAKRESLNAGKLAEIEHAAESELLERWIAGERVNRWFRSVRLRIKGDYVEVSTGQSVTVAGARRLLPLMLKKYARRSFGPVSGADVDAFEVRELRVDGIRIGCTFIPWSEVKRIAPLLQGGAA